MSNGDPMRFVREELEYLAARAGLFDDPGVRAAIETAIATGDKQLIASLREYLLTQAAAAGIDDNPFLPGTGELPPGEIVIGNVIGGSNGALCALSIEGFRRHTAILGGTGTGKTVEIKSVVRQLIDLGVPVWVFDIEEEYRHLAAIFPPDQVLCIDVRDFRRNPFQVFKGETPIDVISRMKDVLFDLWLREGALNVFDETAKKLYDEYSNSQTDADGPSLPEYYAKLRQIKGRPGTRSYGYTEALLNRMVGILNHLGPTYNCVEGFDLCSQLMKTSMVIGLGRLDIETARFFVNDLLSAVAAIRALSGGDRNGLLVVVMEEAHLYIPPRSSWTTSEREPYICTLARLLRKRDVGLILADQVPCQLPDSVMGNMATRIVLQLSNGPCKLSVSRSMGLDPDQQTYLGEMPLRSAVCQYPGSPKAFAVAIPEISLPPAPSEEELRERMEPRLKDLYHAVRYRETSRLEANAPKANQRGFVVPGQPPLSKEAVDYLQDIAERPFVMSTRRDADLNLSSWKGNDLRERLLARKLVSKQSVNTARRGGVIMLLEITKAGEAFLAEIGVKARQPAGKGGFQHRFWQNVVVEYLCREHQGCEAVIEDFRFGKAVDVGVNLDGRWIAIEVGITGLDKEFDNIQSDLAAGYDEVWVCLSKKDRDGLRQAAERELGRDTLDRVQWKLLSEFRR